MNKLPKQLILIGGGASITEGIDKGLWQRLEGTWTIGLNYSYKYFLSTCLCFVDKDFYFQEKLDSQPLIIGNSNGIKEDKQLPNTIVIRDTAKYDRNLTLGIYKASLVGLYALSLAIYLLDEGEIYLLGYDYDSQGRDKDKNFLTHFYQGDFRHRGIGKVNYYQSKGRTDRDFGVYKNEKKIKIYNVGLESKIDVFPKLSYDQFFKQLDKRNYHQNFIKEYIIEKLKGK